MWRLSMVEARTLLGFVVVVGFVAITVYEILTFGSNKDLLIGAWIGFAGAVVSFHYGTSRGSEVKTEIMARHATVRERSE